ncbi:MAG TPA: hypothetical protein VIT23_01115 [Terrimicrobiaceae bacterium]
MQNQQTSRDKKHVAVLLNPEEHATLKKIADSERRTLGAQLAVLALERVQSLAPVKSLKG